MGADNNFGHLGQQIRAILVCVEGGEGGGKGCRSTNYLTKLESTIKTKIIKMKGKHLLFREAVCKK